MLQELAGVTTYGKTDANSGAAQTREFVTMCPDELYGGKDDPFTSEAACATCSVVGADGERR